MAQMQSKLTDEDQSKLSEFFAAYPEKLINDLIKRLVFGAYYPAELNAFFVQHAVPSPARQFASSRIDKACADFIKALAELSAFVLQRFALPEPSRKSFYLLPKINQKCCGHQQTPEEFAEWNTYKRTLDVLVEKVELPYRELGFVAKLLRSTDAAS